MISVIISKDNILGNIIEVVEKNDVNHLKNAFRVKVGEKIRAVDGEKEYLCQVVSLDKKRVELEILEEKADEFSLKVKIDAAIGILKNDKMDLTIQKLTEIGIDSIIPMISKRNVVKISEKKEKWDLISKEALKQCQGVKFLKIEEPLKLNELDFEKYDLVIVPYECESKNSIKNVLKSINKKIEKVLYIIGPEGGFEEEEIQFLKEKGVKPVTLGKRILRAETASIVVGGILANEFE